MGDRILDTYEAKLKDSAIDAKTKGGILFEIRDQLEAFCQTQTYSDFLSRFVPILLNILSAAPVFESHSPDQKLRLCALEIIHRLPHGPDYNILDPYSERIMEKCLGLVKVENEDNAVLCLKIVNDFCRYHPKSKGMQEQTQAFLDLILEIYDSMEQTTKDIFDGPTAMPMASGARPATPITNGTPGSPVASTSQSIGSDEPSQTRTLVKGMHGYKVVAECPIIVVSIFQAHRQLIQKNIAKFTPRIKTTLTLQASPQARAHEEAKSHGSIFTGIAKDIKAKNHTAAFVELVTVQVKTMSFLAYLLRAYQQALNEFLVLLPTTTVRLLRDVPRSHTSIRKELLVAIRHIINFNFREVFLPEILPLLDHRTLIGDSLTAEVTLRPLAYTMLADLIHHVRERLSPEQISRVVQVYVGHLTGDDGVELPGTSYQTMSAKLLLNMAECMSKIEDKKNGRFLMMTVLNGIADKFASMNRAYPNAVKLWRQNGGEHGVEASQESYLADKDFVPNWDETDIFTAMPIKALNPKERTTDQVTENKFLFKNLLQGLKQFFYQLRNSNPQRIKDEVDASNAPSHWNELSSGFEAEEVQVLMKLFREGAHCFQYYKSLNQAESEGTSEAFASASSTANSKEEKDLLETFATIFHHLDPATFHEIFMSGSPSGITFLYEQCFRHPALLHIPQFLLASEATSPAFCGMLLKFLMSRLNEIGEKDATKTSVLLRLFKLTFMAVTLFSQHNEGVLLPHVRELITRSIELSVTADEPTNYYLLLRSLFRSIGGGRFEHLYKEILPLLEMLLEVLNIQLQAAPDGAAKELFVELSLTVPARLSHLLPHLGYLMRPLTVALRSGEPTGRATPNDRSSVDARVSTSSELTAQGLRTLELCVDNLTADYLDPLMAPWMEEIMGSLWRMLKPSALTNTTINGSAVQVAVGSGHSAAHTAVRILGKLGGRNRRFLTYPPDLDWRGYADDEASYDVRLIGVLSNGGERSLPTRLGVDTAIDRLKEVPRTSQEKKSDGFYKRQSLKFVIAQVKLLIGIDHLPDDLARLIRLQAEDLSKKNFDFGSDLLSVSDRAKSTAKKDAQQLTLTKLLNALMFATSIDDLKEETKAFLDGIYRHFMLVELGVAVAKEKHQQRPFDVRSGDGPVFIDTGILADVIGQSLASESPTIRETAELAMQACLKTSSAMFGSEEDAQTLPFFSKLAETFCHACYEEEWFSKSSGAIGIGILINKDKMHFSETWIAARMDNMLKALLYVIKDMPLDLPASIRVQAKDAVVSLVKRFAASELEQSQDLSKKESRLNLLSNRLAIEICHQNRHVRETVQESVHALAASFGMEYYELLRPVSGPLTQSIFVKPLRALPNLDQIGYIDATNFLLDIPLDKQILQFDDHLSRLLYETLALVDAEDETLATKPFEYRTAETIVRLRVAGLKLLNTAMRLPAYNQAVNPGNATPGAMQQQSAQHRARVITIFFKSLYSKNKDVAAAANAGLKGVLQSTSKLPKDLLQNGLRPILMNIQDFRKLSVEGLEGLRTLLQLLHNYFKVEIGSRLLDHMKHIADLPTLQKVSFSLVESHSKMKIVAGIFNIFHLLPIQAAQFLQDLVDRVLTLEASLRRTRSSPFRAPLIKYLDHYPAETWAFFRTEIKQHVRGRFIAQILADSNAGAVREKIIQEADGFVETFSGPLEIEENACAAVNAIHAAYSICQFPEAAKQLLSNQKVRVALLEAAKALQVQQQNGTLAKDLRLAVTQSGEQIMHMITLHLEQYPGDNDYLFDILGSCTKGELHPYPSLYGYLYNHVITNDSIDYQRLVMQRCIDIFTSKETTQKLKWFVFRNVLNPILAQDVMRNWDVLWQPNNKGTALLDKAMTEEIHSKLWKPQSVADVSDDGLPGVDHGRMELLQTSAFLIKYHHGMLQDSRKDLIKFGWNYIRLDDHLNKHAAYCLISYFIHHYETPPKIVVQVYNTLLRAHQTEGRNLVMQSLEVMEPVLKKRLGGPEGRQSNWARLPKKILSEEPGQVQQLINIFQFIVRHPDLFYDARELFAPVIITSINKVAQQTTSSIENRKLAVNLLTLLWQWEERTVSEQGSLASVASPNDNATPLPKNGAVANSFHRLTLIKYMVQFVVTMPERYPVSAARSKDNNSIQQAAPVDAIVKTVELMHKLLQAPYWDDLDIDAMFPKFTESVLCSDHKPEEKLEAWVTRVVNTIQVLKVFLNARPDEWVLGRLPQLQKLLAKPLRSEHHDILEALHGTDYSPAVNTKFPPLLQRALAVIPVQASEEDLPDADSPTEDFLTFLGSTAGELLTNGTGAVAGINILWIMAQRRPEDIDAQSTNLLKVLQAKAKDHNSSAYVPPQTAAAQGIAPQLLREQEILVDVNVKAIDMLSARIGTLGEQRRPYLSVLASLVTSSASNTLCEKILHQVDDWVFNSTNAVPTLKEKVAVLQKMQAFERRGDQTLYLKYMDLIIRIYEDVKIMRSELAVRMESSFLIGLRSQDVELRSRFVTIYDKALNRSTSNRFYKLVSEQQWDVLADSFWLSQIIQLMFGTFDQHAKLHLHSDDFKCLAASKVFGTYTGDARLGDVMVDDGLESVLVQERQFMNGLGVEASDILGPLAEIQHTDWFLARDVWIAYFPMIWSTLTADDREDMESGLKTLLAKDFHQQQLDRRPNCVATMLTGIVKSKPRVIMSPHLMKYLARTYDAWYVAATFMEDLAMRPLVDTAVCRESNLDALVEMYAGLEESDLFYGTWRRRAQYVETNAALSYEQNGIWDKAQVMYEQAQIKVRTGSLPYSQGEYMLWEDQWVLCAQKLQQWDILREFAKQESINDLYLEATWRQYDAWNNDKPNKSLDQLENVVKAVMDAPTPRRMFFQAFISLLKMYSQKDQASDFARICDDNIQLSLKNWHKLPRRITNAHIGLLENFQQLVELHDANVIVSSLHQTTANNLDVKSQELKVLLSTWRDRLPNQWDDINAWQDLVTWRQHIFELINKTYLELLPANAATAAGTSYAYRGYHETAWIINRFAHVARKHQMPEVCINQLSKIYTLPNIEIQEAFLKLREQAKCHYQNRNELTSGLDVINNTNLGYFGQQQKAEFYTLKGMFLSKLKQKDEAHDAFGTALFFDIKLPKAWAEWGRYSDNLFKEDPTNYELASNALSCYLEAAGQYRSAKSRKLLSRILWLLSLESPNAKLSEAYNKFKGDQPWWYWVTFIPQLLNNLSRTETEANIAHQILSNLAKTYPQALFFQLRTSAEDMSIIRRTQMQKEKAAAARNKPGEDAAKTESPARPGSASTQSRPGTANEERPTGDGTADEASAEKPTNEEQKDDQAKPKKPWEHTESLTISLRTSFPLLFASMQALADEVQRHFRTQPDEDAYRLIVALHNDALSYVGRAPHNTAQDGAMPPQTEANIDRFSKSILPPTLRKPFEADFVTKKPTMLEYIVKLRRWRDKLAEKLDRRPSTLHLSDTGHVLTDFRYVWFDETEVPGQYLLHKDKNQDFIRIERFMPIVDLVRGVMSCHRRLKIRGHDGSVHSFAVQHPTPRHSRREEKILQLFRIFNATLAKKKESRRRNLQFHLPVIVPLSPNFRLIQDDPSYVSLQAVHDDYCRRNEFDKDEPISYTMERLRSFHPQKAEQYVNMRVEAFHYVQQQFLPNDIVREYFAATHPSYDDFWLFRRQFSYQLAALTYITFTMYMTQRYPSKMHISRQTGNIWGSELLPCMSAGRPTLNQPEHVPFRLTPNLQLLMGPIHTEGIFACALMAIARCLTSDATSSTTGNGVGANGQPAVQETSNELEHHLSIFIRDEVQFWHMQQPRPRPLSENEMREHVQRNSDYIVNKAIVLAKEPTANNLPASQSVLDLIAKATDPEKLAQSEMPWMPWL